MVRITYEKAIKSFEKLGKFDHTKCEDSNVKCTQKLYLMFKKINSSKRMYIGQLKDQHEKIPQGIGLIISSEGWMGIGFWKHSRLFKDIRSLMGFVEHILQIESVMKET